MVIEPIQRTENDYPILPKLSTWLVDCRNTALTTITVAEFSPRPSVHDSQQFSLTVLRLQPWSKGPYCALFYSYETSTGLVTSSDRSLMLDRKQPFERFHPVFCYLSSSSRIITLLVIRSAQTGMGTEISRQFCS